MSSLSKAILLMLSAVVVAVFVTPAASRLAASLATSAEVQIDVAACKVTPEYVWLDAYWRSPSLLHINHYDVKWTVIGSTARIQRVHISRKAGVPTTLLSDPADIVNPDTSRSSGGVVTPPLNPTQWDYSVEVFDANGQPVCPKIDPGVCVPGMTGDCNPHGKGQ